MLTSLFSNFFVVLSLTAGTLRGVAAWRQVHDTVGVRVELESKDDERSFLEHIRWNYGDGGVRVAERIDEVVAEAWRKHGEDSRRRLQQGLGEDEKRALLDIHNEHRNATANGKTPGHPSAANMNLLLWDEAIAEIAQSYSEECFWGHNPNRKAHLSSKQGHTSFQFDGDSTSLGENLYTSTAEYSSDLLLHGINAFYDEYEDYDFDTGACSGICGHYTQLVWDWSRYVGCGANVCAEMGALDQWHNAVFLVCNYFPAGNYPRQPYATGDHCSQCQTDRTVCVDGLCGGCPSKSWDLCGDYYSNCAELKWACPSNCSLQNEHNLCQRCKRTCDSCSARMLAGAKSCDDGLGRKVVQGQWHSQENDDDIDDTDNDQKEKRTNEAIVIAIAIATVSGIVLIAAGVAFYFHRWKTAGNNTAAFAASEFGGVRGYHKPVFDYAQTGRVVVREYFN